MNADGYDTPQKTKLMAPLSSLLPQKVNCNGVESPSSNSRKPLHPRTPNGSQSSSSIACSSFHIFPNQAIGTPPAKRFHRVRNPFEAALAEQLHLPLIASPSLFQRPTTPQLSSTQFEWTIDDVSSLKPVHLEPHETQFQDSPDPDYEAKAQSAISSYFKEQQIVPSPVDCPLRTHRIILSELNGNTPISKPGRRIRDCGTQTELSLPAVLPMLLEEALRPYLLPNLGENSESESTPIGSIHRVNINTTNSSIGEFKDTSLRRKLFDMHNIIVLDGESRVSAIGSMVCPSNSSPMSGDTLDHTAIAGKLSDSTDKSSFGSLSPISPSDGLSISPQSPHTGKRKPRLRNFLDFCETEALSPILPPTRNVLSSKSLKNCINKGISIENYRSAANVSEQTFAELSNCGDPNKTDKFSPDRSSSPLNCVGNADLSADNSFNIKVSRLVVNSDQSLAVKKTENNVCSYPQKGDAEGDLFSHDDTNDMLYVDDEEMQISQLSAQSSISSSSNSDTPRVKRRSASRKNLSQSFTANWYEDDEQENRARFEQQSKQFQALFKSDSGTTIGEEKIEILSAEAVTQEVRSEQRLLFYRTDSGFNEMTSNQITQNDDPFSGAPQSLKSDISIACCSTPSKHIVEDF